MFKKFLNRSHIFIVTYLDKPTKLKINYCGLVLGRDKISYIDIIKFGASKKQYQFIHRNGNKYIFNTKNAYVIYNKIYKKCLKITTNTKPIRTITINDTTEDENSSFIINQNKQ